MKKIVKKTVSIALLGAFNPVIFQPAWFAAEKIIKLHEGDGAKIEIIHPDIVLFALDWVRIQVAREKFTAIGLQEGHDEEIYDLVLSTFKLLRHTPIHSMGLNKVTHLEVENTELWHKIGHKLAPKEIWNKILKNPGMQRLTIQGQREDDYKGYIRVAIEPSSIDPPGIVISINDHYEIADKKNVSNADEIMQILEKKWPASIEHLNKIINELEENL